MNRLGFRTQYRKFRIMTSKFFSYWFFIIFATVGTAFAIGERFVNYFHVEHLETIMILILVYSILVYIVTERAKVLDDIHDGMKSEKAVVHPTRESVYTAIPLIIARASANRQGRRRIFHAALYGPSRRRIARPPRDPIFALFDHEIDRCVASRGTGMWQVYEIYNITDEEHLDRVEETLRRRMDGEGYEVRTFSLSAALPHLSPLIIGDEDLLVGVDDPRYYRMGAATHLHGRDPVRLATEYFYSLWNDPRIRILKTETSVEWREIERLRAQLRAEGSAGGAGERGEGLAGPAAPEDGGEGDRWPWRDEGAGLSRIPGSSGPDWADAPPWGLSPRPEPFRGHDLRHDG